MSVSNEWVVFAMMVFTGVALLISSVASAILADWLELRAEHAAAMGRAERYGR